MNPTPIDPYKNLIDLLAIYSEAKARLASLESETNAAFLDLIDEAKPAYAELQMSLTEAEAAIKEIAAAHPEWFADAKTVKTPFGQVHSQRTTSHEAPDEVSAIARVKAGDEVKATQLGALIRLEESLNLDALADLTIEELAQFGIVRRIEESVTLKEAKVSLGQAVKAATKRAAKTEAKAA